VTYSVAFFFLSTRLNSVYFIGHLVIVIVFGIFKDQVSELRRLRVTDTE
jgi:hypothetical protein